ncbi:MAG: hypothetical protein K8L99_33610 [Anaerolineae bacterium]|nr:hypothetical protein [Anaerolineae bacterium]
MNTSTEAVRLLEQAFATVRDANNVIDNLIADHDYQDVASLITQAAQALIASAGLLMQSDDEAALEALESAEDLIDAVYDIIDADTDEG